MQAIQIDAAGQCTAVTVRVRGRSVTCNRHQVHLHHLAEGLAVLSPKTPQELQSESTEVSAFVMPPPLNAYVYPLPLYIMKGAIEAPASSRAREPNAVFGALTVEEFERVYNDLGRRALRSNESDAVYDVPAHPLTTAFEEALDDESSDDEAREDDDDDSNEAHNEHIDDEEDWEIEDDDVAPPG